MQSLIKGNCNLKYSNSTDLHTDSKHFCVEQRIRIKRGRPVILNYLTPAISSMSPVEYINDSYSIVVPGHIDFRRTKCMFTQLFVTFQKADNVIT